VRVRVRVRVCVHLRVRVRVRVCVHVRVRACVCVCVRLFLSFFLFCFFHLACVLQGPFPFFSSFALSLILGLCVTSMRPHALSLAHLIEHTGAQ